MKKKQRVLFWAPRIIAIMAILFVSLFALDAFQPELTFQEQILGFLIHMIPSFILIVVLILAWKWEVFGGILFLLIGLGMSPFIFINNYRHNQSVGLSLVIIASLCLPFVLAGVLFILSRKPTNT